MFGLLTKARRNAGFWLSAQLLFVLPNGVLSLCDAMVEGPLLAESSQSLTAKFGCQLFFLPKRTSFSRLLQPRRELQWVRLLNAKNTPAYMALPMACS